MNAQSQFVTTIYPFKMILTEIVGTSVSVDEILPPGASPHAYELRPSELKRIENSTAVFYGNDNLDGWILNLENVNLISLLALIPDENKLDIKVGKVSVTDPHFWTDPLAVKALLPNLVDTLCAMNPERCSIYRENSVRFSKQLDDLTKIIQDSFSQIENKQVMMTHPFFQYFLNRFGFKIIGTIEKNPGIEPTPRELKQIIDKAKKSHLKLILTNPQTSDRPARLVAETTDAKICELDPIGGIIGRETYEKLLLYNTQIFLRELQ
jgi:zinc transport system substrate-binding protein